MASTLLIQPDGSRPRLVAELKTLGRDVLEHSFINIEPIACDPLSLAAFDGVIWVSKNAVKFAHQAGVSVAPSSKMYAVGPATAKFACQQFKASCQCPTYQHDSEALLKLPELLHCRGSRWAIIKGAGGRTTLIDTLTERGALVSHYDVYRRTRRPLTNPAIIQSWYDSVDTIVVTSAEQLNYFLADIPTAGSDWLQGCHWVVPSERIGRLIRPYNCHNITITQSASENAMMEALISMDTEL